MSSTTLSDFAADAGRECEATAADHDGDLGMVRDAVAGEYLLCERHRARFRRVRDGFDGLTEADR